MVQCGNQQNSDVLTKRPFLEHNASETKGRPSHVHGIKLCAPQAMGSRRWPRRRSCCSTTWAAAPPLQPGTPSGRPSSSATWSAQVRMRFPQRVPAHVNSGAAFHKGAEQASSAHEHALLAVLSAGRQRLFSTARLVWWVKGACPVG